jgi:hypothetical protein
MVDPLHLPSDPCVVDCPQCTDHLVDEVGYCTGCRMTTVDPDELYLEVDDSELIFDA